MRAAAGFPLLGAAGALLVVALFFGGGSGDSRLFWIGMGAVVCAVVALTASLVGLLPDPVPRGPGAWAFALLGGFVLWNGVTIWWSVEPDRSWAYANRGLVYLALSVLGLYVGALVPRPAQLVAGGLCLLFGCVLVWALAGKVFPGLFPDGFRIARLRNPVGYWNALALLCGFALPLFLWLSARRRDLGALGVYLGLVALLLTYSRGGALVAVLAVGLWLWIGGSRRESLAALAVTLPVALAVAGVALLLPGVAKDLQPSSVRTRDGALFGVALVVGALLVFWLARRELRRAELRALGAVAVALLLAGSVAVAAKGGWLEGFRGSDTPQVAQGPGRLRSTSSNNRWIWWQEAWRVFQDAPLAGKGAGSFGVARTPERQNSLDTIEPHNIALQALAETGVIGLLLAGGAAVAALLAAVAAVRGLEGRERAAAVALALTVPAYLLHALEDIDWDFVAATAPVFFALGVLIGTGSAVREPRRRPLLAVALAAVAMASLYSLTAPWLGARRVEDAYAALDRNDPAGAVSAARAARELDPLSVDPLWAWALAEALAGNSASAIHQYLRAISLQPADGRTWYALGQYEFELERYKAAYRYLNEAYTRDPYGPAGEKGGLLDQARAKAFATAG